ncbi:GGDEF domain-containing protein [Salinibius halmophilus]|uniref:GGDEF domain-containing protein n=1 Tax=Salinibius halmophilus TaxID=1853216 RepID=UPI000E662368|nr:GGDEF domain-containing protein [Salinibius halmophilus]
MERLNNKQFAQVEACESCEAYRQQLDHLTSRVSELEKMASTDELTQLFNHRAFEQHLAHEMERTRRTGSAMSLIMLDLDHFKRVNDEYGHPVGNEVLQEWSRRIKETVRKLDIACRYGGEEFAVICPTTGMRQVKTIAERLRRVCEETPYHTEAGDLNITCSVGADVLFAADNDTRQDLIARVDEQLYRAKRSGRNQVSCGRGEDRGRINEVSADEKSALSGLFGGE